MVHTNVCIWNFCESKKKKNALKLSLTYYVVYKIWQMYCYNINIM